MKEVTGMNAVAVAKAMHAEVLFNKNDREHKRKIIQRLSQMKNKPQIEMKHLLAFSIFVMLLAYSFKCRAQLTSEMGIGTDLKHGVATWGVGYSFHQVVIEGGITPSLTRNVNTNNYIGGKIGYDLNGFILSAGYYYDHISSDKRQLNKACAGYSLKWYRMINDRGGVFVNGMYINKSAQLTAGIHYVFN